MKEKILQELQTYDFPNLQIIFSDKGLEVAPQLLEELLESDKKDFEELLQINNQDLSFESFEDESILDFYWSLLNHLQNVENSETIRKIIQDFRPKLQDFWNYVAYNKTYFEKLLYVQEHLELDNDQERILYLRIKAFRDRWIDLDDKQQEELKELNKTLSKLSDDFSNNIVDSEAEFEYVITDCKTIKDLPKEVLDIAKSKADQKWVNWYMFDADPTSTQAILKFCHDVKIRQDFSVANYSFASTWKYDNRENILQILKGKKRKSDILWYKSFAQLSLNNKMADSPDQVFDLIEWISRKAREKAQEEIELIEQYFSTEIGPFDLAYYSRIYKEEKYDIDEKELKKYFEFENTLDYLHNFVRKFYGISLEKFDITTYDDEVRVYKVFKDGVHMAYYFLDPYYRKNKRPWAWADNLREKQYFPKTKLSIIVNVCNFQKNPNGKTTLSMRDVETLFHEFGHAIHEMSSESKYSELSWFWVEWDFVELPSQLLENWVSDRDSLSKLAKHVDTWEALSDSILDKLDQLKTYMSGSFVARQNEFALLDMWLYSSEVPKTVDELDEKVLKIVNNYSIFPRGNDYKMYCSFGHIFGGWYAAGYYSYMWAEIIEADVFSRIKEMGMFDRDTWEKFLSTLLGQWTRKKATELFFDFMWREVDNTAFMERKGL